MSAARAFVLGLITCCILGRAAAQEPPRQGTGPSGPAVSAERDVATQPSGGTSAAAGPAGGGGLFDPAAPFGAAGRFPAAYAFSYWPQRPVESQRADLGFLRQDLSVRFPVLLGETDSLFGGVAVRNVHTFTDADLPQSGRPFPSDLWDLRVSLLFRHQFENGWSGGAGLTLSSPSDRPATSLDEIVPSINLFARRPAGGSDAWVFALVYNPVSELPFPIPGVAYQWNPGPEWSVNIGIPFLLIWRPTDDLRLDLSYLPARRVRAQALWRVYDGVSVFGGFEWTNDGYLLADRFDDRERLFYYEKRLPVGVRLVLGDHWLGEVTGGYGFDRLFFAGRKYDDRSQDLLDVAPGFFGMLRLAYRY